MGLGIINFGSLYFLLETYDKINLARSGVMPVNNLGVILLSAAASVAFLGERLNNATDGVGLGGPGHFIAAVGNPQQLITHPHSAFLHLFERAAWDSPRHRCHGAHARI